MKMPDYRAFIMGPDGHVQNRVELRCDDDAEAIMNRPGFAGGSNS